MNKTQRETAIRELLAEHNKSITALGKMLGITRQAVHQKVKCIRSFNLLEIDTMRKAWNLSDAEVIELFIDQK